MKTSLKQCLKHLAIFEFTGMIKTVLMVSAHPSLKSNLAFCIKRCRGWELIYYYFLFPWIESPSSVALWETWNCSLQGQRRIFKPCTTSKRVLFQAEDLPLTTLLACTQALGMWDSKQHVTLHMNCVYTRE